MGPIEYYSFERVLKELQIEEEELKRLVSEGEIRAFRDEDKMKFKKSDIEGLKKGRMTEPTIILPSGESEESSEDSEVLLVEEDTSETLLDIDDVAAEASSSHVPTVDFTSDSSSEPSVQDSGSELDTVSSGASLPSPASSSSGTITDELTFEEDSGSYVLESSDDVLIDSSQELVPVDEGTSGGETFIDSDTGLQTEPLDMESSDDIAPKKKAAAAKPKPKVVEAPEEEGGVTAPIKDRRTHTQVLMPMAMEEPVSTATMFCLVACCVVMLFSGMVVINMTQEMDTPLTGWLTDFLAAQVPVKNMQGKNIDKHIQWRANKREHPEKTFGNREE